MKKTIQISILVMMTFVLGACSPTSQPTAEKASQSFTIVLNEDGKKIEEKEINFEEGDFLQDVMEKSFEIVEENGMITSIDGHASDASKQKYWLYKINDVDAEVGAKEYKLVDGDKIVWNLMVLEF